MVNPTGYTALDLIGFTDQGAYSSSDNYVKNDLVHYSGNIWRCLIDDTSGIAPAEGVNWTLFIGEPTNLVERIIAPVETDPATNAWAVGRQIIYNDNLYEVIVAITAGDALVAYEDDPTNANIKLADPVETQLLNVKGNLSNPNLLDNPWFTVNQRGESTYASATANRFCLDRWKFTSPLNVVVNSDTTITVSNTISDSSWFGQQFVLQERGLNEGTVVTQSIMLSDGTIYSFTAPIPNGVNSVDKNIQENGIEKIRIQQLNGGIYHAVIFINANSSVTIRAIKLELGSVSTLAHDTAPNYAEELLECQRYFYRLGGSSSPGYTPIGSGFIKNANRAYIYTKLQNTMRVVPTITQNGKIYVQTVSLGVAASPCNVESATAKGLDTILLYLSPDTLNQFSAETGQGAIAQFNMSSSGTTDSYIDFSADL